MFPGGNGIRRFMVFVNGGMSLQKKIHILLNEEEKEHVEYVPEGVAECIIVRNAE